MKFNLRNNKNKILNFCLYSLFLIILLTIFFYLKKYFNNKNNNILNIKEKLYINDTFNNKNESENESENNECDNLGLNYFCAYDFNENNYKCAGQKDDARLQFTGINPKCCKKDCSKDEEKSSIKYYCNIAGKCQEYNATIKDSVIMANICGIDNVTNQYVMPFISKEECEKNSDICNKYNDKKLSLKERENSCLNDTNCGICYSENGEGKCVMGSPAGPADLDTYYFCKPSERNNNGSNNGIYKYGKEFSSL